MERTDMLEESDNQHARCCPFLLALQGTLRGEAVDSLGSCHYFKILRTDDTTDFGLNINVKVLTDADRGTKYT